MQFSHVGEAALRPINFSVSSQRFCIDCASEKLQSYPYNKLVPENTKLSKANLNFEKFHVDKIDSITMITKTNESCQNGMIERQIKSIKYINTAMIACSGLKLSFWPHSIRFAVDD